MPKPSPERDRPRRRRCRRRFPELERLARPPGGRRVYLVGGAVRDLLLGRGRDDLDVVVEGDARRSPRGSAEEVSSTSASRPRRARIGELEVDLARARARDLRAARARCPRCRPASLAEDLARRDFTINAMAMPLQRPRRR